MEGASMVTDKQGNILSNATHRTADLLDQAVRAFNIYRGDPFGPLDQAMAAKGESISATKCNSCHKLTEERLVGPGWKGVTTRNAPHWIMNFITNPDPMIEKDPKVQAQLELCLVRMPNQSLTDTDAREILEFMRKNDGAK